MNSRGVDRSVKQKLVEHTRARSQHSQRQSAGSRAPQNIKGYGYGKSQKPSALHQQAYTKKFQPEQGGGTVILLRRELGEVLRTMRQRQGRTLREVSAAARVSLGYLSEVERGQKEASSELLFAICSALNVPLSVVLRELSDRIAVTEGVLIPDTVPPELELLHQGLVGAR